MIDFLSALTFWHWLIFGLGLMALEAFLPGAFFLWPGLAAIVVGLFGQQRYAPLAWWLIAAASLVLLVLMLAAVVGARRKRESALAPALSAGLSLIALVLSVVLALDWPGGVDYAGNRAAAEATVAAVEAAGGRALAIRGDVAAEAEVILVNDDSRDGTWGVITRLAEAHPAVRGINLMRNYGQHNALLCGIRAA